MRPAALLAPAAGLALRLWSCSAPAQWPGRRFCPCCALLAAWRLPWCQPLAARPQAFPSRPRKASPCLGPKCPHQPRPRPQCQFQCPCCEAQCQYCEALQRQAAARAPSQSLLRRPRLGRRRRAARPEIPRARHSYCRSSTPEPRLDLRHLRQRPPCAPKAIQQSAGQRQPHTRRQTHQGERLAPLRLSRQQARQQAAVFGSAGFPRMLAAQCRRNRCSECARRPCTAHRPPPPQEPEHWGSAKTPAGRRAT